LTGFSLAPKTARRARAEKKGIPVMFKSTSTSLILLGVLGVIVGVIAIVWSLAICCWHWLTWRPV
jgi:hypothetical protein